MKPHYFTQEKPDEDDLMLPMAIKQGYVPADCRLGGLMILELVHSGEDPCRGCHYDRKLCGGRLPVTATTATDVILEEIGLKPDEIDQFKQALAMLKSKPIEPSPIEDPPMVKREGRKRI